jgi:hypothetical protein
MQFYKVSAVASAGKTHIAEDVALENAIRADQKSIIAPPTRRCAAQIEASLKQKLADRSKRSINVTRIDRDTTGHVGRTVMDHLKQAAGAERHDKGEILIVTQAGLQQCPHFIGAGQWDLYIDEIPAAHANWSKNLPHTHGLLTDLCQLSQSDGAYARVEAKPGCAAALQRMADNRERDEVYHLYRDIVGKITSPHWAVSALVENWYRTISADVEPYPVNDPMPARYPLWLFAQMLPSIFDQGFHSVTIMGAAFDESVLAKTWSAMGVGFRDQPRICARLARQSRCAGWTNSDREHPNGHRLRISYCTDGAWSKTAGSKQVSPTDERPWRAAIMDTAEREWSGPDYLYLVNLADSELASERMPHGTALPHSPHGLNCFVHIDRVVVPAACLPSPEQARFMANGGISHEELVTAQHRQTVYQAVCRSSIRDLGCDRPVEFIVPDKETAEWLADFWPGCTVGAAGFFGQIWRRNRRHAELTSTARMRQVRAIRAELAQEVGDQAVCDLLDQMSEIRPGSGVTDDLYIKSIRHANYGTDDDLIFAGTAFETRHDSDIARYRQVPVRKCDFIATLAELAQQGEVEKHQQVLISPAYFMDRPDPDRPDKPRRRGRHNVVVVGSIVMIDVDKGALSWREWGKFFPNVEFLLHPSNSATDEYSYHVIFFLDGPCTATQYQHIARRIKRLIERRGYGAKRRPNGKPFHGIDATKLSPENLMYLPSRPKSIDPYFFHHKGDPINVAAWCAVDVVVSMTVTEPEPQPNVSVSSLCSTDTALLEQAKQEYRALADGEGRHQAFYRLGCQLYGLGLAAAEVRQHLAHADYDGHQRRKGEVDQVVNRAGRHAYRPKAVA